MLIEKKIVFLGFRSKNVSLNEETKNNLWKIKFYNKTNYCLSNQCSLDKSHSNNVTSFHCVFFFAEVSSLIKEDFLEFPADTLSAWFLGSSYFSSSSISISAGSSSCISFSSYYSNSYYRFSSYKRSALDSFVIPKSYPLKLDNFKVCSLARWRIVIKHDCIDTRLALSPKSFGNSCITPVNWIYSISSLLLDFLVDEVRYF